MNNTRKTWVARLHKIAYPVLSAMAEDRLKETLPLYPHPDRAVGVDYLEALSRTLAGIAPWLELDSDLITDPEEQKLQAEYRDLARRAIANGTNPQAKDYCVWNVHPGNLNPCQPVVESAYMSFAFLKAPQQLFYLQDKTVQTQILDCMHQVRTVRPIRNNWIMFTALTEAFLYRFTGTCEPMKIEYALSKHSEWYVGDGMFQDGDSFMMDYYNSYVIQPMFHLVTASIGDLLGTGKYANLIGHSIQRYCEIQERSISGDGSYPPYGRSIVYRMSAFTALSYCAYHNILPKALPAPQVRCALDKMTAKIMSAENMFDKDGFLTLGLMGEQKRLLNFYTNVGSLYCCSTVFLPLGLAPSDVFWTGEDCKITWEKIWAGEDMPLDVGLHSRETKKFL